MSSAALSPQAFSGERRLKRCLWPFVSHSQKLLWASVVAAGIGDLPLAPVSKQGCLWALWCGLQEHREGGGAWQVRQSGLFKRCLDVGFEGS